MRSLLHFSGNSATTNKAVSSNNMLDRTSQGVKAAVTTVLSSRLLNEARVQWAYDDRYQNPQSSMPQIDIKDFGTLGGNSDGPIVYKSRRFELVDSFTWTANRHAIKVGGDVNINLGAGDDRLTVSGTGSAKTLVGGAVNITGGLGNDVITLSGLDEEERFDVTQDCQPHFHPGRGLGRHPSSAKTLRKGRAGG